MRRLSLVVLALFSVGLLAGCSGGEVSAKDMEESQKKIDAENKALGAENPDKPN
jgi:uncharacterized lipoprotein